MSIESVLRAAVKYFELKKCQFALAGGIIASIYRSEKRVTADVDIALAFHETPTELAEDVILTLGLKPAKITIADLKGGPLWARKRRNSPNCMVVGRNPDEVEATGIDILLPELCWVTEAVARAQVNQLDLGFGPLPCVTVEDFILAKLDALKDKETRFKDLDDLQSIFLSKCELDLPYLIGRMQKYHLPLPKLLRKEAHYLLVRAARKIKNK